MRSDHHRTNRSVPALAAVLLLTAPAVHAQCDPADLFGPSQDFKVVPLLFT